MPEYKRYHIMCPAPWGIEGCNPNCPERLKMLKAKVKKGDMVDPNSLWFIKILNRECGEELGELGGKNKNWGVDMWGGWLLGEKHQWVSDNGWWQVNYRTDGWERVDMPINERDFCDISAIRQVYRLADNVINLCMLIVENEILFSDHVVEVATKMVRRLPYYLVMTCTRRFHYGPLSSLSIDDLWDSSVVYDECKKPSATIAPMKRGYVPNVFYVYLVKSRRGRGKLRCDLAKGDDKLRNVIVSWSGGR